MAKFYPISYSGLTMYETCPYNFYRQKIMTPKVSGDKSSPNLIYGNNVHKALEDFVRFGKPIPDDMPHLKPYTDALSIFKSRNEMTVEAERSVFVSKDRIPLRSENWFDNFYGSWINAKIDLTITIGDTALLRDYKTGKTPGDKFQLDIQAALLFADMPNINVIKSQFVYVDKGEFSDEHVHVRGNEWTEELLERTADYEYGLANDLFSLTPSPKACKFCPVVDCQHNNNTFIKK